MKNNMIKAIFAIDEKGGLGKDGTLPWPKNKEDMKHFQHCTTNSIVVMGSNTWNDPCFPAPLKDRINIVVSNADKKFEGAIKISGDIKSIIKELDGPISVWIIGGRDLIMQCLDIIEEISVTKIKGDFDCDKFIHLSELVNFECVDIRRTQTGNIYKTLRRKL